MEGKKSKATDEKTQDVVEEVISEDAEIEEVEEVEEVEEIEVVEEVEIVDYEKQFNIASDKFIRLNAEFMNYKKRTEKEKSDIYKYANEKFIMELLPVIDNIDRALDSIEAADDHKAVIEGVNLIKKNFDDFVKKNGVEVIEAIGKPFDPSIHHAVMTEANDEVEEDTVIDEFQVGYTLNSKVIRPSMVKVSKKSN